MNNLEKLIHKAAANGCRIQMRYDPSEPGEEWGIKYYPEDDDDAHFYAYHVDLDSAARQILDELKGFPAW